jgi:hypothetical protein
MPRFLGSMGPPPVQPRIESASGFGVRRGDRLGLGRPSFPQEDAENDDGPVAKNSLCQFWNSNQNWLEPMNSNSPCSGLPCSGLPCAVSSSLF